MVDFSRFIWNYSQTLSKENYVLKFLILFLFLPIKVLNL